MLLEFELENDGAFATSSSISLIASKLRDQSVGRVVDIGDPGHTQALTSALILGKNGSGKSTLVSAMRFVSGFVKNSANESRQGAKIAYEPNLIIDGLDGEPTRYRVTFSMRGVVYEFAFSHDRERITQESLQVADRSVRFRKMYERTWRDGEYEYSFGEALSGRRTVWQDNTRDNALFISTASQLNSEDIKPAFEWLASFLRTTHVSGDESSKFTAKKCLSDHKFTRKVVTFLQSMDINVENVLVEEEPVDEKFLNSTFAPEFIDMINKQFGEEATFGTRYRVFFEKKKSDGSLVKFPLRKESTGTIALFNLAGPLFDTLENGYCLLVDEINTSLHPIVVSFLIDLFANERINRHRAQLLFTSHDTSVLARHKMRRDQVWVIESGSEGASLVPLSDFSPRREEALDKGYLGGRYGGIPVVTPALLTSEFCED